MARQEIDLTTPQPNGKMGEPTKSAWEKTNDNFEELYDDIGSVNSSIGSVNSSINSINSDLDRLFSPCAISPNGLKMSFSGSTITLSSGYAFIPSVGKIVRLNSPISKTLSGMSPNTWYHMYLMLSSPTSVDFELVTTSPSTPYCGSARTKSGDNTRRYLGSVRVGASGVLKFEHRGDSIMYLENTNAAPFLVLAAGSSVSTFTVITSMVAPPTAYAISLVALNAATNGAYTRLSNGNGPSPESGYISLVSPGGTSSMIFPVDSNQFYTYAFDASPSPPGAAYHRVNGYYFER